MKITGPGQPGIPQPPGGGPSSGPTQGAGHGAGIDGAAKVASTPGQEAKPSATGRAFAEKLAAPPPVAKADAPRPSHEVSVRDLATDLRSGKLDARAAIDKVIDRVVNAQLGRDAPTHVREQVQAALRDALDGDPLLAEKLRSL